MLVEYYEKQLYPLQDKVLRLVDKLPSKFYLTGGTALSRAYLHHRYSDDLDFFMNQAADFEQQTQAIVNLLQQELSHVDLAITYDTFARCFVHENDTLLKLEFVNDVPYRIGMPQPTDLFTNTDTIENILVNKICALSRNAAKYYADIWQISLGYPFNWKTMIEEAKKKDMWVDESLVLIAVEQFDVNALLEVRWAKSFVPEKAKEDFQTMSSDILLGRNNSLYPHR